MSGVDEGNTWQWRRRQSGWSSLGRTTFQRVIGPVLRLQRHSDNWARCPTQARLRPLCTDRSRFFPSESGGALRGPTGLHRHPRISILQVVLTATCCRHPPFTYTSDRLFAVAWPLLKCRRRLCMAREELEKEFWLNTWGRLWISSVLIAYLRDSHMDTCCLFTSCQNKKYE